MIFTETKLRGAFTLDIQRRGDNRGFFGRSFCRTEFEAHGLEPAVAQANVGFSVKRGTIRGLHFQAPPSVEAKLVRATRGAVLDVIVDLRPESETFLQHVTVELTDDNRTALYVPPRFAHGFQTLADETEITYQASEFYTPSVEGGLSPFDARLAIAWPLPVSEISEKDTRWAPIDDIEVELRQRMRAR
jgi:dTDP-4-dehydrorhamnose 3,5-epimerase